jgi:hypothetical protein
VKWPSAFIETFVGVGMKTITTAEPHDFIDTMLAEAEAVELQQRQAYYDLVAVEMKRIFHEIEKNFEVAEKEKALIDSWYLQRSAKQQERIDFLALKLKSYLEKLDQKTLEMPNITLRFRKQPDKIEVVDVAKFLEHADQSMLNLVPESASPSISKIKAHVKMTGGKLPKGCRRIFGEEAFSYKLKYEESEDNGKTDETGIID